MNTWLSFISLLLTVVAGILKSRKGSTLRLYFWSQLLNAPVVFAAARYLGDRADDYALLYVAATLPILECCCFMIWECGTGPIETRISVAFGLLVGMVASFGMPQHPAVDYVTFAEGVFLAMIGFAMLLGERVRSYAKTIGTLSLALSCYDFGYMRNEDWSTLNGWLPSAMCSAAYLLIVARRLRLRPVEA